MVPSRLLPLVPSLIAIAGLYAADSDSTLPNGDAVHTVTISATRLDSEPFDQPYAIHRADRTQLDETNARTLTDALNFTPGVYVQRTAQNQASPYIRGLTGEQTLLLFDGVRLNHATMRGGPNQYSALIPDEQIGAVDTILGSTSAVTGSDGLTGALDFRLAEAGRGVTKAFSPWAKTRLASAEGGSIAGGIDGTAKGWRWSVDGSYDAYGTLRGGRDAGDHLYGTSAGSDDIPNTSYRQDAVGARAAYDGWAGQTFELSGGRSSQHDAKRPDGYFANTGNINGANSISRYYDPQTFTYGHARHRTHDLGPFTSTQLTGWVHQQHEFQVREDLNGGRYRRREYDDTITTIGGDLQLTNRIAKRHELTYGGTAYVDSTANTFARFRSPAGANATNPYAAVLDQTETNAPGSSTVPDGSRYVGYGVFAQDVWSFAQNWELLGGVRWSRFNWTSDVTNDRTGFGPATTPIRTTSVNGQAQAVTGNARLAWHFAPVAMVFAGIGQGFRAPNLNNLVGIQDSASSGITAQGNPDLDPERSVTYELGTKYQDGRDTASLSVFRTDLSNLIQGVYLDTNGDGITDTRRSTNANSAQLYGGEIANDIGLPLAFLPLSWRLAIVQATSYVHGTVDAPQADRTTNEEYLSRANLFFGKAGLRLDIGASWYVLGQTRWSDAYDQVAPSDANDVRHTTFGDPSGSMPGFAVIDVMGGWHTPDRLYAIDAGIQNVGNVSYRPVGSGNDGAGINAVVAASARF